MKTLIVILSLITILGLLTCGNPVNTDDLPLAYEIPINRVIEYTGDSGFSIPVDLEFNGRYKVVLEFRCISERAVYSTFTLIETAKLFKAASFQKIGFEFKRYEKGTFRY